METLNAIRTRRSVREFSKRDLLKTEIELILDSGRWAPSGLNNQPWRFVPVTSKETLIALSGETHYKKTLEEAPCAIAVYMDKDSSYDRVKDLQAIGACIQNMLLTIHDMGLGACWLGEILKNKERVNVILKVPESFELMALIALGHPLEGTAPEEAERKDLNELIYCRGLNEPDKK